MQNRYPVLQQCLILTHRSHDCRNRIYRGSLSSSSSERNWNGSVRAIDTIYSISILCPRYWSNTFSDSSRAVVLIIGLGFISTYSGYVIGQFRQRYPFIHSMADAGDILMGRIGREVLEIGQLLFFLFATGSHLLTFTVMMNTLTEHGTCSIVFGVVGLILSFLLSLPRTMKNVSWLAMTCKDQSNFLFYTTVDNRC